MSNKKRKFSIKLIIFILLFIYVIFIGIKEKKESVYQEKYKILKDITYNADQKKLTKFFLDGKYKELCESKLNGKKRILEEVINETDDMFYTMGEILDTKFRNDLCFLKIKKGYYNDNIEYKKINFYKLKKEQKENIINQIIYYLDILDRVEEKIAKEKQEKQESEIIFGEK